jgi:hypothetical protein
MKKKRTMEKIRMGSIKYLEEIEKKISKGKRAKGRNWRRQHTHLSRFLYVMTSYISWDVTPSSPVNVSRCFASMFRAEE